MKIQFHSKVQQRLSLLQMLVVRNRMKVIKIQMIVRQRSRKIRQACSRMNAFSTCMAKESLSPTLKHRETVTTAQMAIQIDY